MNIINQNPYRVIGVFANSKTKERVANINRIKAFIKVNKNTEFPLDLKTVLPEINRSLEDVNNAEANLTLPNDQVKYAQFWFINETSFDEIAFNHLYAGDITKALEIWSKKDNFSSLHNRIVVFLSNNDCQKAIPLAERFYTEYGAAFIGSIADNSNLDSETIEFNFVDALCKEFGLKNIMPHISKEEWKTHLESQAITPILEKLQSALETAKSSKGKSSKERYNAGVKLANGANPLLKNLREFLSPTDLQYQMIADKVGLEVLQCGIDYYNGSNDDDAAHKAMPLQRYALSVVVGKMAKDRCNENVKILQKIIDELPPKEIAKEIDIIKKKIEKYLTDSEKNEATTYDSFSRIFKDSKSDNIDKGIILIKECAPFLVSIKEFEGAEGDNYINLSSIIVSVVLGRIIDVVNKSVKDYNQYPFSSSSIFRFDLEKVLNNAWMATLYMSAFDVNPELKQRFQTQKATLRTLLLQVGLSPKYSINFKIETEAEMYNNCKTIDDYKNYIQLFPNGKYIIVAKEKLLRLEKNKKVVRYTLVAIVLLVLVAIIIYVFGNKLSNFSENNKLDEKTESYRRYIELSSNSSIDLCEKYLKDFPNSEYRDSVLEMIYDITDKNHIIVLESFVKKYPKTHQASKAYKRIQYVADSLYDEACKINTIDGWEKYQTKVPNEHYRNSQYKIDSLKNLTWNTESKAWQEAQKQNTLSAYNKYKTLYPKGKHISQAEKKIIDLEVADVYAGDYGTLPSMDMVGYGSGPTTHITVENNTSYTLTILYSGTESKRLVIRPNGSSSITLKNGVYRIAASVNAANVRKYAGTENLNGGSYESSYYISTTRSYRYY